MTDYDFLSKEAQAINKRKTVEGKTAKAVDYPNPTIEFFDVELPATSEKSLVETVREKMVKGDQLISKMQKEVDSFDLKGQEGFDKLTEMIGQVKTLDSRLEAAAKEHYDPPYQLYKKLRNIYTERKPKLEAMITSLSRLQRPIAHQLEMDRRKKQQEARKAAAKLQAEIDKQHEEQKKAEEKAAKKEKRDPVHMPLVTVDQPTIPKETKTVTESGRAAVKMVLVPTINDTRSSFIFDQVIKYFHFKYLDLAEKALKKAISEGILGLKGAPGVTVEEKADVSHRRR